jgi:hypothetical protein
LIDFAYFASPSRCGVRLGGGWAGFLGIGLGFGGIGCVIWRALLQRA